jgi:hypothetical protein
MKQFLLKSPKDEEILNLYSVYRHPTSAFLTYKEATIIFCSLIKMKLNIIFFNITS